MGLGLRALRRVAGTDVIDRIGARGPGQRLLYRATRDGFRVAGAAGRTFKAAQRNGKPARLSPSAASGIFDLTPTEEQQLLQESFRAFAEAELRPAAASADAACEAPPALLDQVAELGLTMLGVPEELGGAVSERSTMTAVLAAEALAYGDMGLALAALSSSSVASALSLWGDGDQQATYLPGLLGEDVAVGAVAIQEPGALFDPRRLGAVARRAGNDYVLTGVKSLVPRAAQADLLVIGANVDGQPPSLFIVETATRGVLAKPQPTMGVRAGALGEVRLQDVRLPAAALLGGGDPAVYAECVRRARLAWCALANGTAQAVLDYVIPYVNDRVAFGEPISHRQAVAFAVADMAIELEGMRLTTWRAASRADAGKDFAKETAVAQLAVQREGCSHRI